MRIKLAVAVLVAAALMSVWRIPSAHADYPKWTRPENGGVFVPHGTDGRGDCEPADTRPVCHKLSDDGNYLPELTMVPPFAGGIIDHPETVMLYRDEMNANGCWRIPPK